MVISQHPPPPAPSTFLFKFAQLHKYFSANPHFRDSNPKYNQTLVLFFFLNHCILTCHDPQRGRPTPPCRVPRARSDRLLPCGKAQTFCVSRINRAGGDLGRGSWRYLFAEGWEQVVGGCFVSIAA